ncbi:hypothetical protein BSKO_08041 [Bryopsis sp. KO-2023]|nr:hypothetical protein BSKO_08041 [Bryopsis sp. KO-2023]
MVTISCCRLSAVREDYPAEAKKEFRVECSVTCARYVAIVANNAETSQVFPTGPPAPSLIQFGSLNLGEVPPHVLASSTPGQPVIAPQRSVSSYSAASQANAGHPGHQFRHGMVPMASGSGIQPAVRTAPVIEGVLDQLPASGGSSGGKQASAGSVGVQKKAIESPPKTNSGASQEVKSTPVRAQQASIRTHSETQVSKPTVADSKQAKESDKENGSGSGSGKPKVVVALPGRPPPEKSRKGNWARVASRPKVVHYTTEAAGSFRPKKDLSLAGANGTTNFLDPSGWGTAVHQPAQPTGANPVTPPPPPPLPAPPHHGSGRASPSLPDSDGGSHYNQMSHTGGNMGWGGGSQSAAGYPRNYGNGYAEFDGYGHDPRWGEGNHPHAYMPPHGGHPAPRPPGSMKLSAAAPSYVPPSANVPPQKPVVNSSGPQIVKAEIPNMGAGGGISTPTRGNDAGYNPWGQGAPQSPAGRTDHWQGQHGGGVPHYPTDHAGNRLGGAAVAVHQGHHGQGYAAKPPVEGEACEKVSMMGSVDNASVASGGSRSSRHPHQKSRKQSAESSVTEPNPHVVLDVYDSVSNHMHDDSGPPPMSGGYSPLPRNASPHPPTNGEYEHPGPGVGGAEASGSSVVESVFVKPVVSKRAIEILTELCSSGIMTESRFLEQGITNLGNTCFLGSAVQLLLGSGLFCALLVRLAGVKDHLNDKRLPTLCALGQLARKLTERKGTDSTNAKSGMNVGAVMGRRLDPIVPKMLSPVLEGFQQTLGGYRGRPEEQDAQEFLLYLLDKIESEILLVKQEFQGMEVEEEEQDADDSEGWFVAGRNNKASIRRTAGSTHSTILSALFCGTIQSQVRVKGKVPSVTSHRFNALDLDIGDDKVKSVDDALRLYTGKDFISDYRVEGSNQPVTAEKFNLLCGLPPVLLVSLKRYVFTASGMEKIQKRIRFAKTLEIPGKFMAEGRQGAQYELIATCSHHGQGYGGDHYTTKVLQPNNCWVHFNDSTYRPVKGQEVANDTPYLMLYRKVNRTHSQQQQSHHHHRSH